MKRTIVVSAILLLLLILIGVFSMRNCTKQEIKVENDTMKIYQHVDSVVPLDTTTYDTTNVEPEVDL